LYAAATALLSPTAKSLYAAAFQLSPPLLLFFLLFSFLPLPVLVFRLGGRRGSCFSSLSVSAVLVLRLGGRRGSCRKKEGFNLQQR